MVVLREGMCPGLDENLVRDLRAADIKTGQNLCESVGGSWTVLHLTLTLIKTK